MPLSGCIKMPMEKTQIKKVADLKTNFSKSAPQKNTNLNWWDYEIGTPKSLTNTLILLNGDISSDEKKKYTALSKLSPQKVMKYYLL